MGLFKFVSWNISGCHNVIKRKKIFTYLKHKKADTALIQETHLNDEECNFGNIMKAILRTMV